MSLVIKYLDSPTALREAAGAWDDLWRRSDVSFPTARAELVALWCETFAADRPFRATIMEDDGQFVAALPWIENRRLAMRVGSLPGNCWTTAGDLLLDPSADAPEVCDTLLQALKHQAPALCWFDGVAAGTHRWSCLFAALEERGTAATRRRRFVVPRVRIDHDWASYLASRSYNHRRLVRRALSRAQGLGPTELKTYTDLSPAQIEPLVRTCFELEASGWKRKCGGAVLDSAPAWSYFLAQARQLAAWGQLSVAVLEHRQRPIAFEYGWLAKGVYASAKVGYDEQAAALSPGQLLRYLLFEQFHTRADVEWVDFAGPASEATSKWATETYPVDRVVLSNGSLAGGALVAAYRHVGPLVRGWRGSPDAAELSPADPSPEALLPATVAPPVYCGQPLDWS